MRRALAGIAWGILLAASGCGDNHPVPRATGSADAALGSDLGAGSQAPDLPPATAEPADALTADAPTADGGSTSADVGGPPAPDAAALDGPATPPGATLITGAVQKGPFLVGQEVKLTRLDDHGDPMGAPLATYTTNALGEFSFTVPGPGPVEIVAKGNFNGQAGPGGAQPKTVTLRALVEARGLGPQSVFVNVLTHLTAGRALKLFRAGGGSLGLAQAIAQAEGEFHKTLGQFVPGPIRPAHSIDLFGVDDDSSAHLFVLESIFASDPDTGRWLDIISTRFEATGVVDPDWPLSGVLHRALDVPLRSERMRAFLRDNGRAPNVPDMDRALDFDGDGIADKADADADGDGIAAAAEPFVEVAGGDGGPVALRGDGTVWGVLGGQRLTGFAGIKAIVSSAAGLNESQSLYALKDDGTIWTPTVDAGGAGSVAKIPGVTDVKAIFAVNDLSLPAAARAGVLVVKNDATVWLAPGNAGAAVQFGALTGAIALGTSNNDLKEQHVLAVKADGSVWLALPSDRNTAIAIPGVGPAMAVFGAPEATPTASDCVLKTDKTVWCWGYEGVNGRTPLPATQIVNLAGTIRVAAQRDLTAVKSDGSVWHWGIGDAPKLVPACSAAASASAAFAPVVTTIAGTVVRCNHDLGARYVPPSGPPTFVVPCRLPR